MKKLIALLLCILLCVPVFATAEVLEFEDFNLVINDGDLYQLGVKGEGQILVQVFPAYDENATFHENFGISWTSENFKEFMQYGDTDSLCQSVLEGIASNLTMQGVLVNSKEILAKEVDEENGVMALYMLFELDYSGAGYDLQLYLHEEQLYVSLEDAGTYIFTFAADSNEKIMEMLNYMDAIEMK